ncbi:MAG: RluA family pseudouridine synthase [Saccharofermentanales bacterium]
MISEFSSDRSGIRLDVFLSDKLPGSSRTAVSALIKAGNVTCNGIVCKPSYKTVVGEVISIDIPEPEASDIKPMKSSLDIAFEDEWITVINKPRGMVVHPAPGHRDDTLVNALLYHYKDDLSDVNGKLRPGIVHRIDKDTSGLLLIVKKNEAHLKIAEAIAKHEVARSYYAICCGTISETEGTIDLPVGRDPSNRLRNTVIRDGKRAVTHFKVIDRFGKYSLVRLQLETGRTHQIRVHMAHIGHPVLGDQLYGGLRKDIPVKGQLLHAYRLGFRHPVLNSDIIIEAPLPDDFKSILEGIGYKNGEIK